MAFGCGDKAIAFGCGEMEHWLEKEEHRFETEGKGAQSSNRSSQWTELAMCWFPSGRAEGVGPKIEVMVQFGRYGCKDVGVGE